MAEFIPKRDETLEADKHQKWLEDNSVAQRKVNVNFESRLGRLEKANAASARQVATINGRDTGSIAGGVPAGGVPGEVVRKSLSKAIWSAEWLGILPEYWVTLADGAGSYTVTDIGPGADISKALLPVVEFSSDGKTMYAIESTVSVPHHVQILVNPTFDGEEFTIWLPNLDGGNTPFYSFDVRNDGAYSAHVSFRGPTLVYLGSSVVVNGSDEWDIAPGFWCAWFVLQVTGFSTAVVPIGIDDFYNAQVAGVRQQFAISKDGALSVAAIPRRTYNATASGLTIGLISASVGTAPSGVDLTMLVKKNGTTISSAFTITAGTNTGTAVLTDTAFAAGDYLTFEVTQTGSAADLNVQIWAG